MSDGGIENGGGGTARGDAGRFVVKMVPTKIKILSRLVSTDTKN